jgi:DNA-directed RNA polymerase
MDFIMKADEPFCFLAFSVEYKNWLNKKEKYYTINISKEKIDPQKSKKELMLNIIENERVKEFSHLPIYLDATCNGIQHLAALSKDSHVAPLVNLTKSNYDDSPKDIYSYVIPFVEAELRDLAMKDEDNKILKNFKLTRSMIKKPIMTIPYSVTTYGIAEYLENEFFKKAFINEKGKIVKSNINNNDKIKEIFIYKDGTHFTRKNIFNIASIIHKTFFKIFPNINSFVKGLKEIIKFTNTFNSSVSWDVPTGLTIEQNYRSSEPLKIRCSYKNLKYQVTLRRSTSEINSKKQISAFLPNMIHSLDSSVLIIFVELFNLECEKLRKKGVYPNIITVHDCFATSVGNVTLMENSVKESFVLVYNNNDYYKDFVENIYEKTLNNYINKTGESIEDIKNKYGDKILPKYPKFGELNIKEVFESKYFIN